MGLLDIIIIVLFFWGAYKGWTSGLVNQLVSFVGFLVGLLVASLCYSTLGEYLAPKLGTSATISDLLAFIILWVLIPIFLGFVATGCTKVLKQLSLGWMNSALGAIVGVLKFLLLLSCIFNAMSALNMVDTEKRQASRFYEPVRASIGFLFDRVVTTGAGCDAEARPDTFYIERSKNLPDHGEE